MPHENKRKIIAWKATKGYSEGRVGWWKNISIPNTVLQPKTQPGNWSKPLTWCEWRRCVPAGQLSSGWPHSRACLESQRSKACYMLRIWGVPSSTLVAIRRETGAFTYAKSGHSKGTAATAFLLTCTKYLHNQANKLTSRLDQRVPLSFYKRAYWNEKKSISVINIGCTCYSCFSSSCFGSHYVQASAVSECQPWGLFRFPLCSSKCGQWVPTLGALVLHAKLWTFWICLCDP